MRIAALDIGSNSIHLVVVEAAGLESFRVLAREKAMVGLAQGLAVSGRISDEAFAAGMKALQRMKAALDGFACDRVMAFGTATLRDAANAADFLAGAKQLGLEVQVISGEEEARLIHLAVAQAYPFPKGVVALVDIGGASTELTWVENGRVLASCSVPWGLQRLADAFPVPDPPKAKDYERVRRALRGLLKEAARQLPKRLPEATWIFGTSGTLEDLAKAAAGSDIAAKGQVRALRVALWEVTARRRCARLSTVPPRRAAILHIGALWAELLMGWTGADAMRHLPVGLREGMVWEALRHGGELLPPLRERRWSSVEALAARIDPDPAHSAHVQGLADRLFVDLQPAFELGELEREWLACAARLHDVGFALAEKDHHKHGAYMIQHGDLKGFWPEELAVIAQVVRHHRGKAPDPAKHEAFAALPPWHQAAVRKLTAILRVADALDRRRDQRVGAARLRLAKEGAVLTVQDRGLGDLGPEREAVADKGRLLEKLLDRPLRLRPTAHRKERAS
ncbi:MAG TPA: Ppx/GppA phosphatase family protein [Holophagaceae bacterium]|nr:Ppx/GppA phosphatase family protein [Holophagaceae bacterium]